MRRVALAALFCLVGFSARAESQLCLVRANTLADAYSEIEAKCVAGDLLQLFISGDTSAPKGSGAQSEAPLDLVLCDWSEKIELQGGLRCVYGGIKKLRYMSNKW